MATFPQHFVTEVKPVAEIDTKAKSKRRPDIDVIRVGLTWGILVYHTVLIYTPYIPYYIKDPFYNFQNFSTPGADVAIGFITHMNAWNMPMFFLLSGISAFYALNRRTLAEFYLERYHRLLVPCLVIMAVTQLPLTLVYFAPLEGWCLKWSRGELPAEWDWLCKMNLFYQIDPNETYLSYLHKFYEGLGAPSPHQGWFLANLFFYTLTLGGFLSLWHPSSASKETCWRQILCCCFKRAKSPAEFANAAAFWLGGTLRLAILPPIVLFGLEAGLRETFSETLWFFGAFNDFSNTFHYGWVFFVGFALSAADDILQRVTSKRFSWASFVIGNAFLIVYSALAQLITEEPMKTQLLGKEWIIKRLVNGFLRSYGEWLFMIGLLGICRNHIKNYSKALKKLVELAMPFYVIHQQILIPIAVGTLRVPVLHHFPFLLLFSTLATFGFSYLITLAGPIRYFFGLQTATNAILPGSKAKGLVPGIIIAIIIFVEVIVANVL